MLRTLNSRATHLLVVFGIGLLAIWVWIERVRVQEAAELVQAPPSEDILLLAGFSSNNLVSYDLDTRVASEILYFAEPVGPRGIAQSPDGDLFVSTRHGNQNVLRFTVEDGMLHVANFTESIGRYGPTQIQLDAAGHVYVACDSTHEVRQYADDGELLRSYFDESIRGNVGGAVIHGSHLYATHIFRGAIARFQLDGDDPPDVFRIDSGMMKTTYSIGWSHRNKLLVGGYRKNGKILELDPSTGEVIGTFVDLEREGFFGNKAMLFHEQRGTYLFAAQRGMLEYDQDGHLIERHDIDLVDGVFAMCFASNRSALEDFENSSVAAN